MRRKIIKNSNIIICLIFVALFTVLSFLFDQRVVQQENEIRKVNSELSNSKILLNENIFLLNSLFNISKEMGILVCAKDKCLWLSEIVDHETGKNCINIFSRYDKLATIKEVAENYYANSKI